jgi:hypothetical protein
MSELVIVEQGGVVYGDFEIQGGYFGPTGGGGYIVEFKGNYLNTGGTFAVGTGTGVDPACEFSGTGKTYTLDNASAASYQHVIVSGTLSVGGTRLAQMNISQKLSVTGTLTIASGNEILLDGNSAGFDVLTGTIDGLGDVRYRYKDTSDMVDTGIIACANFIYQIDDEIVEIPPRIYEASCTVRLEYEYDASYSGQTVRFLGGERHTFLGKLEIRGADAGIITPVLDWETYRAEVYVGGLFKVKSDAFPAALPFQWRLGDGTHEFQGSVQLYFSYASGAAARLEIVPGDGTVVLHPAVGSGVLLFINHRLSRIHSTGVDIGTYNRLILFTENFNSRSSQFNEGFFARELVVESHGASWSFRPLSFSPVMICECDIFRVIGSELNRPTLRARKSLTPDDWGLQVNQESHVHRCKFMRCDASYGETVKSYNGEDGGLNANVEFYDRGVRTVSRCRNELEEDSVVDLNPPPTPITERLLERVGL